MELPKVKVKAAFKSPRKLMIYSRPKTGKTSALAQLDNALILDFERGTDFLDALKIRIDDLKMLKEAGELIIGAGRPYKYIVVDTITKLEDMCIVLANQMYKETPMGKTWNGTNVLSLANGAGYLYLREAVQKITAYIETLAERIIYIGHLKLKFIEKNSKEVQSTELDLTGKIKSMMSADVDAIGMLYRDGHKNILSFKTTDEIICGARPDHLKMKEILLSELSPEGELKTYWDQIYID